MPTSCWPLTILLIQNRNATLFRIMDIVIYREKTENTHTNKTKNAQNHPYLFLGCIRHSLLSLTNKIVH
jgi:hypothetical protein